MNAEAFDFVGRDTLFSALVGAVRRFGRHTPGQWEDAKPSSHSYGDLLKMTLALGRMTARLSEPGEHVGVLMPNLVATIALAIGLSAWRRVPCMLNYTAGVEGMQNACHTARIRTVLTSRAFLSKADLVGQAEALRGVRLVYLEDLRESFGRLDKLWLMAFALWWPLRAVPSGDPEAPAVVLFTSGSEGKPKGVVLSHRALLANVAQVLEVYRFGPEDRIFNCLPVFHSFGLTAGTLLPMVCGARLMLYTTPLHYKAIPGLIRDKACTVLFSTSTFLNHYARHAQADDLSSLKTVVAGAEKLAEPVRHTWRERFGIEVLEGYGATEAAPVLSVNHPDDNRPGSVGRLLPGLDFRILPVAGIERGGELHVRGPNLMSGYYRHEAPGQLEPPRSSLGEGWHNTGDVVEMDADGHLRIQGRLKRFAKVAGEMVSLETAEAIARIASHEGLHAAMTEPDASRGERIVLYTTDPTLTRERLLEVARSRGQAEIAVPRAIHVLDDFPLLGSGKVDYMALRRARGEGESA
ncbi:MAG: AMP-binding protein [Thiobacillaceae bacterium]|jgi:acyl-[acyl-carrier-protein]-phospholipid O-acyltransferase/long-chain-fatty-acid--[acyl-carrier-protein] ligase|nr:AMP-binding protein [Thiobacillaceae bacterium]